MSPRTANTAGPLVVKDNLRKSRKADLPNIPDAKDI